MISSVSNQAKIVKKFAGLFYLRQLHRPPLDFYSAVHDAGSDLFRCLGSGRRSFRPQTLRQNPRLYERVLCLGQRARSGDCGRHLGPLADLPADALGPGRDVFHFRGLLQPARQIVGAAEACITTVQGSGIQRSKFRKINPDLEH